ncbi:D-alanine aminotransferase [Vibrio astriarenae]|nr:D-alanine aminotransferase [Vibrio sp. C7]
MTSKNNVAFFNGEFTTLDKVTISPFDRGFLFGDSIYEVTPVYNGKMLAFERHTSRLIDGLNSIGIESPYTIQEWASIAKKILIEDEACQLVYVQVTRGNENVRKHRFPIEATPTVLMFSIPFTQPFDESFKGCDSHLIEDLRWKRCDVKSTSLMGNVLAYYQLYQDGVAHDEALLVRDNHVVEAPSSNVFIEKNGVIYTPPVSNILPGITRTLVIEQAIKLGYQVIEEAPSVEALKSADEVWVSNSMEELKPIISVNREPIGKGVPGATWLSLFREFQRLK